MTFRRFHRTVALLAVPPLAVAAVTGLVYRIGRNWFGMSDQTGKVVRSIHEGAYLGASVSPVYVLATGAGLLALIGTGVTMMRLRETLMGSGRPARRNARWFHRVASIILVVPLAVTALTGIGFRLTQSWFGWSKERAQWLMDVHQGTLLFGKDYRLYYVLFIGLGLLLMLGTGMTMTRLFRARRVVGT
ncbi:MAG: PepSY domain-containing protein [Phycisphaerales bacterium]